MLTYSRCALALAFLVAAAASVAATAVPPLPAASAAVQAISVPSLAAAASAASAPAEHGKGGAVDKRVIEDGKVRIEETRLRGQTQSVTVTSKLPGVKAYEVIQPPLGKDPSHDPGAAGKRTWSLFDF